MNLLPPICGATEIYLLRRPLGGVEQEPSAPGNLVSSPQCQTVGAAYMAD